MRTRKTSQVTKRFLEAVHEIIGRNKTSHGSIDTVKAFAISIGQSPQNFQKLITQGQHVGTVILSESCVRHRINPTWLILGEGEKFLKDGVDGRVFAIEKRLTLIEKKLTLFQEAIERRFEKLERKRKQKSRE